jgi:hypothetical protein
MKVLSRTRLSYPTRLTHGCPATCVRPAELRVMSKVLPLMSRAGAFVLACTQLPAMASWGEA